MSDGTYAPPPHGWTCFHCGETFTTVGTARTHFGATPDAEPGCLVRVGLGPERGLLAALRKAEEDCREAWRAVHEESTEAYRALYAAQTRHGEALRDAEELGYARGLRDAAAEARPPEASSPAAQAPGALTPPAYDAVESQIVGRYRVEKRNGGGFWPYCVKAGDGTAELFVGHMGKCQEVAQALQTACLDGAYLAALAAQPPASQVGATQTDAPSDVLTRCATWCDEQARSGWWGRTVGDMVRAFAKLDHAATPAPLAVARGWHFVQLEPSKTFVATHPSGATYSVKAEAISAAVAPLLKAMAADLAGSN